MKSLLYAEIQIVLSRTSLTDFINLVVNFLEVGILVDFKAARVDFVETEFTETFADFEIDLKQMHTP